MKKVVLTCILESAEYLDWGCNCMWEGRGREGREGEGREGEGREGEG